MRVRDRFLGPGNPQPNIPKVTPPASSPVVTKTCHDCGTSPVWWRAGFLTYCRDCAVRAGHDYLTYERVDVDKLLTHFGGPGNEAAVESFLEEVKSDY